LVKEGHRVLTRPLGTDRMLISPIGLGTWALAGPGWPHSWGPQDDDTSVATIRAAVEAGINWIDTAPFYGLGHAEEIVGRAISRFSGADRPLIFTKCGLAWDTQHPAEPPRKIATPASMQREVDASLRRLGVEQIDLYFVHWPGDGLPLTWPAEEPDGPVPDATPLETYWETMASLKAAGKVRAIGLSNHGVPELMRAEQIAHIDAIQPQLSALNRTAAPEIGWCARNGTEVIVFQAMHSGLLTGSFSAQRVAGLPVEDWRRTDPDFTSDLDRNLVVADAMRTVAARHALPTGAVAVAWALAWPGVTGAVVGARHPDQVSGWLPAAGAQLTAADLDIIAGAISKACPDSGPVRSEVPGLAGSADES
jgi:aryl-alcohol dehydrogenase-like predicted oxidoreductase